MLSITIERELGCIHKDSAREQVSRFLGDNRLLADKPLAKWDAAALLRVTTTAAPSAARQRATASPMSCAAPVTSAAFPARRPTAAASVRRRVPHGLPDPRR
jgi:hypothetical protein